MAIKKTINFKGIVVEQAYVRVIMPTISPGNTRFEFVAQTMAHPDEQFLVAKAYEAAYSLEGSNPIEQAYEYLKTLPEYEGCIDC